MKFFQNTNQKKWVKSKKKKHSRQVNVFLKKSSHNLKKIVKNRTKYITINDRLIYSQLEHKTIILQK